jgi:hypothetical protein
MIHFFARTFALLTLFVLLLSNARADSGSTDETLKRFFPDRNLSRAAIKIVDRENAYYIAGDTFEIAKDGSVRMTNAAVVQVIRNDVNGPPDYISLAAANIMLQFKKPVKALRDLRGNKLISASNETGVGLRIADN